MGAVEMTKVVDVDGSVYAITHQNPTKAFDLGIQLTKVLGEPVAAMAMAADDPEAAAQAVPFAIRSLLSNIKPGESIGLIKAVLSSVERQGDGKALLTGSVFDSHFQGRLGHMMKVFQAAVEFQFEDFFNAIGDAIASAMEKALSKKASQSQSTSAGQ